MKKKIDFDLSIEPLKILPNSEEIEKAVLNQIVSKPEFYNRGYKFLRQSGIFYSQPAIEVWDQMTKVIEAGGYISFESLRAHFKAHGRKLTFDFLWEMSQQIEYPSRFEQNCLILNEYWFKRSMHKVGYYINQHCLRPETDALELLGEASEKVGKIYQHIAGFKEKTMQDGANELLEELKAIREAPDGIIGIKSSVREMNNCIKGYRKGNLIVVAASTGEGKTTLEVQEMLFQLKQEIPVGCISLEMKQSELLLMMACDSLGLESKNVLSGMINEQEQAALNDFLAFIKTKPLYMTDKAGMRVGEARALARTWKKNNGIQILYVDHMHLMYDDIDHSNPEQRFTSVANKLKELAKELDIPVVALAQLARKDTKTTQRHDITDLKYAGGIEQAADVIILIFRPHHHKITENSDGTPIPDGLSRLIVGKLRLIPKQDILCFFTGTRFVDWNDHQFSLYTPPTIYNWRDPKPSAPDRPNAGIVAPF